MATCRAFPGLAAAAALTVSAMASPPVRAADRPDLAEATRGLKAAMAATAEHTRRNDGFFLDAAPGSPRLLEVQWAAVRRWSQAWMNDRPDASEAQFEAAAKHDAGLEVSAVRLDRTSLLIGAQVDELGTAFVLRRAADGGFVAAMAIDEPGTWGGGGPPDLAAWRSDRASFSCRIATKAGPICGPLAPQLLRLPDEADGARRFAVLGSYAQEAGATQGFQLSVWRWDGRAATPLLAFAFAQMADNPVIAGQGPASLVLHAKDDFKRMFACGSCSGRQVEITVALPAQGASRGAMRSLVPDLDLVDDLYDRLFRSQPYADLATDQAAQALATTVKARREDASRSHEPATLGLILGWRLGHTGGGDTLCLSADNLESPQLFRIEQHAGSRRIISVSQTSAAACEGPGSNS